MKTQAKAIVIALAAIQGITGCATVSQTEIKARATEMRETIDTQLAARTNHKPAPLVERVKGPYLGTATTQLAYESTLPAIFNDVTFNFSGRVPITVIGERISAATKLPVQIRPDVFISGKSLVKAGYNRAENATPVASGPVAATTALPPLPGTRGAPATSVVTTNQAAGPVFTGDYDTSIPMDYTGTLAGYLNFVSGKLGISWKYEGGTIIFYRLTTKIFSVKASPGSVEFGSGMTKGGASSGTSGTGSFESKANAGLKGEYSVWTSIKTAVDGMLTAVGNVTVDQASGTVVVTDTKEAIDTIGRYIDMQNAILTRKVEINVRVLRVATNNTSDNGIDLSLVYQKMAAAAGNDWTLGLSGATSLVSSNAGTMNLNFTAPGSRFNGSQLLVKTLNELGTIVSDQTMDATTSNRVPVPIAKFNSVSYLAETKPATGGGTGGGVGVPGLTPGSVTTGFLMNLLPTVFESGSMLLRVSLDQSTLSKMNVVSTGSGETLQKIETPETQGTKFDVNVPVRDGESIILMGLTLDTAVGNHRNGATGYSQTGTTSKETEIIIVTPRVRPGV